MSCLYHASQSSLSVGFCLVVKTEHYVDHKDGVLCGYAKLEMLKRATKLNHFALKSKLYLRALQVAFDTIQQLSLSA